MKHFVKISFCKENDDNPGEYVVEFDNYEKANLVVKFLRKTLDKLKILYG